MTKIKSTDKCPSCKKQMGFLYNDFITIKCLGIYPEIRGQICNNKKCIQFNIQRIHDRNGKRMTKEETRIYT